MRLSVVYRVERELGLSELVRANRLTMAGTAVRHGEPRSLDRTVAAETDPDLYPIRAVLVTTGWNLNDDVFDLTETWSARKTPEDKQLNEGHDCTKIRGHIVSNTAATALPDGGVGEPVADDISVDELPPQYHLVTDAVVYRHWSDAGLQKEVDDLLGAVDAGGKTVSMECLFSGFDYALKGPDGSEKVVARGSKTAFLTKHLKAYGGTGRYGEYRVGRLLRSFIFSGIGVLDKNTQANPASVILAAGSKVPELFSAAAVYAAPPTSETPMNELETAKKELAAHLATQTEKVGALTAEVASVKDKLVAAEARVTEGEKLLKDAKSALDAATASKDELQKTFSASEKDWKQKLDESAKANQALTTELATLKVEKQTLERTAKAKDALGLDAAAVAKFVTSAVKMDDAEFASHLELVASMKPTKATPVAGVANEEIEPNEPGASTAGKTAPALVTAPTDGVSSVAKSIAEYLGAEVEE